MDNRPISEQLLEVGTAWAHKNAEASMLEESKTAVLSQRMLALGDMAVSRAETIVKGSPEYALYISNMVNKREEANVLRVHMKYLEVKSGEQASHEANERVQARL